MSSDPISDWICLRMGIGGVRVRSLTSSLPKTMLRSKGNEPGP